MMDSADSLDERAATLAAQYSLDPDRVRHALVQAEECRFWRFRHHGVMKTDDVLLNETWSVPGAEHCRWLLRPSLEEPLALSWTKPSDWLDLFENAVPWEVRQRRLLLLDFVPYSDLPAFTLDELADVLESFVKNRDMGAPHPVENKDVAPRPEGVGWIEQVLGPLYPRSSGLPPAKLQLTPTFLSWRPMFIGYLVSGLRSSAQRGDRSSTRAAAALWTTCRSSLREILEYSPFGDDLRREARALVEGTGGDATSDAGGITALALLAMHCSVEIAFGTHRKTRRALGPLIELDDLHRPRLRLARIGPPDDYNMLLKRDAGSPAAKAVSQQSRHAAGEGALWKQYFADYISDVQELMQAADKWPLDHPALLDDPAIQAQVRESLAKHVLRLYHGDKEKVAEALGLSSPGCPYRLCIPADLKLEWKDVTLRLESDNLLTIQVRKGKTIDQCHTWHFQSMTFTDRRCPDEVRPTDTWLMLAGILKLACPEAGKVRPVGDDRSERKFFHLSIGHGKRADKVRNVEKQLIKNIRAKLGRLVGICDDPPFKSRKDHGRQHAYEIMFKVEAPPKKIRSLAIWSPRLIEPDK